MELKSNKAERLARSIASARAHLEALKAELGPKIEIEARSSTATAITCSRPPKSSLTTTTAAQTWPERKRKTMGTRHLTIIKAGDKVYAQYGQWDGYPDGQGITVWKFVKKHLDVAKLKRQLARAKYLTQEEIQATWTECGAVPKAQFVTMEIAKLHTQRYPLLSRDAGAECLKLIQDAKGAPQLAASDIAFAADSLMCEFVWMLDLVKRELVVFKGFNTEPLPEGAFFKALEITHPPKRGGVTGETYYPVREWVTIPFAKLKKMGRKEFLDSFPCEPEEAEEPEGSTETAS